MNMQSITPISYVPQDKLYVWMLVNPASPVLAGSVDLSRRVPNCATFIYAADWWAFVLSEDLPLAAGQTFSAEQKNSAPGAVNDTRPDRWGERIIRHIDRPARLSILELLLFAGDDRLDQWPMHFLQHGVCAADLAQVAASVDRDALRLQRRAFC